MFSNLRMGSQLHVLHKTGTPYIEIGTIETTPSMPMLGYYPNMPSIPIDIQVRVGEKVTTYQQIPANAESADVVDKASGEHVCIFCTKDALNNELQAMKQKSIETINSVEYHKQRIKAIDMLVGQLNPEIAEKQQMGQEIGELKQQLQKMQQLIEDLKTSSSKKEK